MVRKFHMDGTSFMERERESLPLTENTSNSGRKCPLLMTVKVISGALWRQVLETRLSFSSFEQFSHRLNQLYESDRMRIAVDYLYDLFTGSS